MQTVSPISTRQTGKTDSIQIAIVTVASSGQAKEIRLESRDKLLNVIAHGAEVSYLDESDRVLVIVTSTGAIIMNRLRKPHERPAKPFSILEDGSLMIEHDGGIQLRVNDANISIDSSGRIFVDGNQIYTIANGLNRIQGSTIELN